MRFLSSALCAAALCAAGQAYAGAWTQDPGNGLFIMATGTYYNTGSFFDNAGNKQSQPTYSKYELNPYFEYGLRDGLTVGTNLSLQRAHQDGSPAQTNWGIGDSEFFLRKRLWQAGGFVVSAEPMFKLPSPESGNAMPRLGGSHPDAGMGLSGGYSFKAYGLDHYADLDTQYRYRFGAPKDQVRITGTLGIGIAPRWTLMPQAFLTYRTATPANPAFTESSADDYDLVKLQLSAVYKVNDGTSLQFGGFGNVDGKNTGAGDGVLLAIWKHL